MPEAGILEHKAAHVRDVPEVFGPDGVTRPLVPFVDLVSTTAVEQVFDVDMIYGIFLR